MRNIFAIILAAALFFSINSCAIFNPKPTVLKMFNYKVEYSQKLNKICELFSKKYKNYKIEIETIPYEAQLVLKTRLKNNQGWDIMMIPVNQSILENAEQGNFLDITNEKYLNNIYEKTKKSVSYKDKIYALPIGLKVIGTLYNKNIFRKYNIEIPESYTKLKIVCKKLTENNITPFTVCAKEDWVLGYTFAMLYNTSMGDQIDPWMSSMDGGLSSFKNIRTDSIFDALFFIKSNAEKNVSEISYDMQKTNFAKEKAAMMVQDISTYPMIKSINNQIEVGIFPLPSNDDINNNLYADVDFGFAVSGKLDKKKLAGSKKFMEFLASDEIIKIWNEELLLISAFKNSSSSNLSSDIQVYLKENKIVRWNHEKWPVSVFEESKRMSKEFILGKINKDDFIKKLDKLWFLSKKK